jgi:hypothetical protein
MLHPFEAQETALASNGQDPRTGPLGHCHGFLRPGIISEDHRRRAFRKQRVEQAHLRRHVVVHGRVIVHVVAAQIGKSRNAQGHPVKPALIEAVARGLHRRMGHAFARQFGKQPVQRHWVGRRQRAVFGASGRRHAGCAQHGGLLSGTSPDLSQEGGDRGLSGCTGHRRHHTGLRSEEGSRHARQRLSGILGPQHRNTDIREFRVQGGDNGHGAPGGSLRGKPCAICLHARQRKEQVSGFDHAAVGRQPGNRKLGIGGLRSDDRSGWQGGDQGGQFHEVLLSFIAVAEHRGNKRPARHLCFQYDRDSACISFPKRGLTPRNAAERRIMAPTVGAAFMPAVA